MIKNMLTLITKRKRNVFANHVTGDQIFLIKFITCFIKLKKFGNTLFLSGVHKSDMTPVMNIKEAS